MQQIDLDNLSFADNVRFNSAASRTRKPFDALVAAVSKGHERNLDWIVSSIATRNKYQSPLFMRCCRLMFVNELLAASSDTFSIRVADRALAETLRARFGLEGRVTFECTESLGRRVWRLLRPPRQLLIAAVMLLLRALGRRPPKEPRNQPITLIDTFVLNTTSGDEGSIVNGTYKDRYFPGLMDELTEDERSSIYFLPSIIGFRNPIGAFRTIRDAHTPFIVHDDYLRAIDYLYTLASPLRLMRVVIPDVDFEGFPVGPMLREERWRNSTELTGLWGVLYCRFAKRFAEAGVKVRLLVDWHENQPIDRGLIIGFHRFHRDTRIVGYQGYVVAKELHIYTHPTRTEVLAGAVPDLLTVTGPALQDDLREFADIEVGVAPGFRFRKLWRERKYSPSNGEFTVVVGLPIGLEGSAHILQLLASDRRLTDDDSLRIWVKPHPTYSPEQILAIVPDRRLPDRWKFVTGDFHDVLEQSHLLIGNASSTLLEALAKGVPVIVVAPSTGIVENVIAETIERTMWAVCASATRIADEVDRFRRSGAANSAEFEQRGREIRASYFSPVTRESVLRFLELGGASTRT